LLVNILRSKIHRATVTDARVDYAGSITIDKALTEEAGLMPHEKVLVVSLDSGERLETYVIEDHRDSGKICMNGAAAKVISKGEKVIIMAFCLLTIEEAQKFEPKIVHVNEKNHVVKGVYIAKNNENCPD